MARHIDEHGGREEFAKFLETPMPSFYKAFPVKKDIKPKITNANTFLDWLEKLGARIVFPDEDETMREVRIVQSLRHESANGLPGPIYDQYREIPLVAVVSAGRGRVAEEQIESWVMVYVGEPSIRGRPHLIAVRVGQGEVSMEPLISPRDIVVVDLDERTPKNDGNVWLVRDPKTRDGAIKRVKVDGFGKSQTIAFYSDNFVDYPPQIYSVELDFDGRLENAIVGRCVWHWRDLTRK